MNFFDIKDKIDREYKSHGNDPIKDNIIPLLNNAKLYRRAVGFFSSSAFDLTDEALKNMRTNGGKMQIITSPILSKEDVDAIELGIKYKEQIVKEKFILEFEEAFNNIHDDNRKLIIDMILDGFFEIKIVTPKNKVGHYHDKIGIIDDFYGNSIAFIGSSNESRNGLLDNYERVTLFFNWDFSKIYYNIQKKELDNLWNKNNPNIDTYEFEEAIKASVIKIRDNANNNSSTSSNLQDDLPKPRDYQQLAINSWVNNNYNGFYVMATGTGKTFTALFSLQELLKKESNLFTVIAVPYKHLVTQWMEDVEVLFPNIKKYTVMGEEKDWDKKLKNQLLNCKYNKPESIIVVSTIDSFYGDRFESAVKHNKCKKLLIVDEAHNFLNKIDESKYDLNFEYKIGLSATPVFGKMLDKTTKLLNFFGGEVFRLPIDKAIEDGHLVKYKYNPIFVSTTEEDEKEFKRQQSIMSQCYDKNGIIKDHKKFSAAYRGKLRAISMAENKILNIAEIISSINVNDHFIVYCSDGKIDDGNLSVRHLNKVVEILISQGYSPGQFTATESSGTRINLINYFNEGVLSTLVAIKCLDEGINIPSIKTALILSSNDNYREFVQRRGRILRKYKEKECADIHDIIVLPSSECIDIAKIEFRRLYEYAKLSMNFDKIEPILLDKMNKYNLTYEDIKWDNEFIEGADLDE